MAHLQRLHEHGRVRPRSLGQQPQTQAHALATRRQYGSVELPLFDLFGEAVDIEFALATMAIYWFTATSASSARFYYENTHVNTPTEPTAVPIGLASFAGDLMFIRRFVDRDHENVVSWHEYAIGVRYAAHQAPDVLIAGLGGFFGDLLADRVDV
jgi:epoxide hydrolase